MKDIRHFIRLISENDYKSANDSLKKIVESKIESRYKSQLLQEAISSRIDEIESSPVFKLLGREYIENKFEEYKERGVVPDQKVSLNTGEMIDMEDRDYEEILPYIFKYLDQDVQTEVESRVMDEVKGGEELFYKTKLYKKFEKHYNGFDLRDVFEDDSQIRGTFTNWLALRNKKSLGLPKSLRQKITFKELSSKVEEARRKVQKEETGVDVEKNPDWNIPDGFSFLKESGDLRLYKWHTLSDVCELDSSVRKDWLALTIDLSGKEKHDWCVNSSDYAQQYGFEGESGSGKFDYPYYLVRKKEDGRWVPHVLLHGNSKQAKDRDDYAIEQDVADELMSGLISEEMIRKIYQGVE